MKEIEVLPKKSKKCIQVYFPNLYYKLVGVNKINGKTGDVTLYGTDIALSSENTNTVASTVSQLNTDLGLVEEKIPSEASSVNKLADKTFVGDSIEESSAVYLGTFNTLEELKATSATNNDYGFVKNTDSTGSVTLDRYRFIAKTSTWLFEYSTSTVSFNQAQWDAINSTITQVELLRIQNELLKKAVKDLSAENQNLAMFNSEGNPVDSGVAASNVLLLGEEATLLED